MPASCKTNIHASLDHSGLLGFAIYFSWSLLLIPLLSPRVIMWCPFFGGNQTQKGPIPPLLSVWLARNFNTFRVFRREWWRFVWLKHMNRMMNWKEAQGEHTGKKKCLLGCFQVFWSFGALPILWANWQSIFVCRIWHDKIPKSGVFQGAMCRPLHDVSSSWCTERIRVDTIMQHAISVETSLFFLTWQNRKIPGLWVKNWRWAILKLFMLRIQHMFVRFFQGEMTERQRKRKGLDSYFSWTYANHNMSLYNALYTCCKCQASKLWIWVSWSLEDLEKSSLLAKLAVDFSIGMLFWPGPKKKHKRSSGNIYWLNG